MLESSSLIGKEIHQFRIEEYIARGGMGMVFKAFDSILSRTVALKIIPKGDEDIADPQAVLCREEARKRLIQEAKTAGRLAHPNIVTIHSYGDTPELQYICMEYVRGKTLGQIMKIKKVLSEEEVFPIFEQILLALEAANQEGIIHRDIKPSNIMITEDQRVKVMDFGIAKLPSLSMTVPGIILGTPFYMSPEQISGKTLDIRSDLFSTGAVLYEVLTGRKPFEGENTATLTYKIIQSDPVPPNELNVRLSPQMVRITLKALAKDPNKRYANPKEMLEDLQQLRETRKPATPEYDETEIGSTVEGLEKTEVSTRAAKNARGASGLSAGQPFMTRGGAQQEFADRIPHQAPLTTEEMLDDDRDPAEADDARPEARKASKPAPGEKVSGETVERKEKRPGYAGTILRIAAGAVIVILIAAVGSLLLKPAKTSPPLTTPKPPVQQPPVETVAPSIGGAYTVEGTNPNGSRYQGTAVIQKSGDAYTIIWSIAKQSFSGSGSLSGNTLTIHWQGGGGQGGAVIYTLLPNGVLKGVWANGSGSETLYPRK